MSESEQAGPPPEEPPDETPPGPQADAASQPSATPPPTAARPRRLTRSRTDRVIAGVCGGLGEYLGVDAVIVRIAALILLFAGGAGFLVYVIGWIVIPEAPAGPATDVTIAEDAAPPAERTTGAVALGIVFVALGAFFLLDHAFPDLFAWQWIWPIALIVLGVIVLARARR